MRVPRPTVINPKKTHLPIHPIQQCALSHLENKLDLYRRLNKKQLNYVGQGSLTFVKLALICENRYCYSIEKKSEKKVLLLDF